MNKLLLICLAIAVGAAALLGLRVRGSGDDAEAYHNNQIQVGDIDDNGYINFTGDVIALARIAFGLQPAPPPYVIPVAQPHEARIQFDNVGYLNPQPYWSSTPSVIELDPDRYPSNSTFVLAWTVLATSAGTSHCVGLSTDDDPQNLMGSPVCTPSEAHLGYYESSPMTFPPGSHVYVLLAMSQGQQDLISGNVAVVARWTEQ